MSPTLTGRNGTAVAGTSGGPEPKGNAVASIILIGPGRAGLSMALAAQQAGHTVVAVAGRSQAGLAAAHDLTSAPTVALDDALPGADLAVLAVRDDAIATVAATLRLPDGVPVVHLSGLAPVSALDRLRGAHAVGALHPLQSLPTPLVGAARLAGAWAAVTTTDEGLHSQLVRFARSLGMQTFDLDDAAKPLYHAAAAAAANFPIVALSMAADLFAAAGVSFGVAEPLVTGVVANAFELGPRTALTGPVARGDIATVAAQLEAVGESAWYEYYVEFVRMVAALAGRQGDFEGLG